MTGSALLEPGGRSNVLGAAGLSGPNSLTCHAFIFSDERNEHVTFIHSKQKIHLLKRRLGDTCWTDGESRSPQRKRWIGSRMDELWYVVKRCIVSMFGCHFLRHLRKSPPS